MSKEFHLYSRPGNRLPLCSFALGFFILAAFLGCGKGGDATAEIEGAIKDVIIRYDKALMSTYKSLNDAPLEGLASEKERVKNRTILLNYEKEKISMESELKEIKFTGFKMKNKKDVDVTVLEKWRWRHVNSDTGKETKPWRDSDYRLLYHMTKDKKKGWIVDSLEFVK